MDLNFELPDSTTFEREIPETFKISDLMANLDSSNARSIRHMSEDLSYLVDIINNQSKKLNLLMAYILIQEEDPQYRAYTQTWGGSHLSYISAVPVQPQQILRIKIFLYDEASAVYCYGRVLKTEAGPSPAEQLVHVDYVLLRHQDRELLIRASVHEQSRQLKIRAEQKYQPT